MTTTSWLRRMTTLAGCAAIAVGTVMAAGGPAEAAGDKRVLVFEGELQDAGGAAIRGIYPVSFAMYRKAKGGKASWREDHFVAVDGGKYVVELGREKKLPTNVALGKVYLGVAIGGAEVVRNKVVVSNVRDEAAPTVASPRPRAAPAPAAGRPASAPAGAASAAVARDEKGRTVVDYAESAGIAYEAEHAKVADKIGSFSADDIEEKLKSGGGKAKLGSNRRFTNSAGGEGGIAYEIKCPKNHVVTGVRGGGGIYLDSIQLICSPLE